MKRRPTIDVLKSSSRSVAKFSRGLVSGSQLMWTLELACGHTTVRYTKLNGKAPSQAQCAKGCTRGR